MGVTALPQPGHAQPALATVRRVLHVQHPAPDISAEQLTPGRSLLFSVEFRLNVSRRALCSGLARADSCTLPQSTHRCA